MPVVEEIRERSLKTYLVHRSIVMDAFRNPYKPCPEGGWIGGEIVRQWVYFYLINIRDQTTLRQILERAIPQTSSQFHKRFVTIFGDYAKLMVEEAIDRSGSQVRNIKSYIDMRRDTIGGRPMAVS